jgi:hypothetical protein
MAAIMAMSTAFGVRAAVSTRSTAVKAQAPAPKVSALSARRNGASVGLLSPPCPPPAHLRGAESSNQRVSQQSKHC